MTDYRILVKNKSGARLAYFLFCELPEFSADKKGYQNVYMSTPPVPSGGGAASFKINNTVYAITGTNPGSASLIGTSDFEIVKLCEGERLGSTVHMTSPDGQGAEFDDSRLEQNCGMQGSFCIMTDKSFKSGSGQNQFIGIGAQDPLDPTNIVPVSTFLAEPDTMYYFKPTGKYYVSAGEHTAGQTIDVSWFSKPAEIDLEGKAASIARVAHNYDGTFAVSYN